MLTGAQLAPVLDTFAQFYFRAIGDYATFGLGNSTDSTMCRESWNLLSANLLATAERPFSSALGSYVDQGKANTTARTVTASAFSALYRKVENYIAAYQIPNATELHTFLAYLNTTQTPKWSALMHPLWRDLFEMFKPGLTIPPTSIYAPVTAMGSWTGGVFVDTGSIDYLICAGGFLKATWAGNTGARTIAVTGTGYNPLTSTVVTVHWSGAIATGSGSAFLTPDITDATVLDLSAGTVTGGTGNVSFSADPNLGAGRLVIPWTF